jgi:hypothetical protein
MNSDKSDVVKVIIDGFLNLLQTSPTPLAIVGCILVIACIALVVLWNAPVWARVLIALVGLGAPCILLMYIVGSVAGDPKFALLKNIDDQLWTCLDKTTNGPCWEPPGAPPSYFASSDVVIKLQSENPATTATLGYVYDPVRRTITNIPPDCSKPLPQVALRGDITSDWKTICWNNPTKWVRKDATLPGDACN